MTTGGEPAEAMLGAMSTAPSTAAVGLGAKLRYARDLARNQWLVRDIGRSFEWLDADLAEYEALLREHVGIGLDQASVLEIGFGARPYRLLALAARGVDVVGVDMESPMLDASPRTVIDIARTNGVERAAKSVARYVLIDRAQQRAFTRRFAPQGFASVAAQARLIVDDATTTDLPDAAYDLVYSEDVLEHVPAERVPPLVERMASWIRPSGIALIRPNVWTGIIGGHDLDWIPELLDDTARTRRGVAWGHLRDPGFDVNTQLNRLWRRDYRRIFEQHFEILEERPRDPELGREYLSAEAREALADIPDDELFSNQVLFVLRKRS